MGEYLPKYKKMIFLLFLHHNSRIISCTILTINNESNLYTYPCIYNWYIMFENLWNQLVDLINLVGYSGLFIASFLENLIPPIPSEVIMPLGGYLASIGKLNILMVIIVCSVGSTLGNLPYYFVGRYFSHHKIRKFVEKYGHYVRYKPEYLDELYHVFKRNDRKIVFLGRFLPGARGFIGLPAGSAHMDFMQFLGYTFAGTAIRSTFLVIIGYYLGQNREEIVVYVKKYDHYMLYAVIVILLGVIWWTVNRKRKKK